LNCGDKKWNVLFRASAIRGIEIMSGNNFFVGGFLGMVDEMEVVIVSTSYDKYCPTNISLR